MQIRHPRALDGDPPRIALDVDGEHVAPNDDGSYDLPDDSEGWLERFAAANGVDADDLRVDETATCDVVKSDGEVCGRELPCQYHDEEA